MSDLRFRADLLKYDEVDSEYVSSALDEQAIAKLVGSAPVLLEGSRGSGKTMLLKRAYSSMSKEFKEVKRLPVYVSLSTTILVKKEYFRNWILTKFLHAIKVSLHEHLNEMSETSVEHYNELFGIETTSKINPLMQALEEIILLYERSSYCNVDKKYDELNDRLSVDLSTVPVFKEADSFLTLIRQLCSNFEIERIVLLIDEASHNFLHDQQRQFFSLFRNLTSEVLICKAAVYPGITSYGDTFQLSQDAYFFKLNRSVFDNNYIGFMREIIKNKLNEAQYRKLEGQGAYFNNLILSCSGNPRNLIKILILATDDLTKKLTSSKVTDAIKSYYLEEIWHEHIELLKKYKGHETIITWGRDYIEDFILPVIKEKNNSSEKKGMYFAIDTDNTKIVQYAIDILEYAGILSKTKGTFKKYMNGKNRYFARYELNMGLVVSRETKPIEACNDIMKNPTKSPLYWGTSFKEPNGIIDVNNITDNSNILKYMLSTTIGELDLTPALVNACNERSCKTIGDILEKGKIELLKVRNIGPYRSKKIYDEAMSVILEYVSS